MSFFDDKNNGAGDGGDAGDGGEEQKIMIGDQEFSLEEAQELVKKGQMVKEVDERYSTDISKVYPKFTKQSQILKDPKALKRYYEDTFGDDMGGDNRGGNNFSGDNRGGNNSRMSQDDEVAEALARAEEIGLATKKSVSKIVQETVQNILGARDLKKTLDKFESMGNPYEDKNLPKFRPREIIEHMRETGIRDPKRAYNDLYEPQVDQWKINKLAGSRPKPFVSERGGQAGSRKPSKVRVTDSNLKENIAEALQESIGG